MRKLEMQKAGACDAHPLQLDQPTKQIEPDNGHPHLARQVVRLHHRHHLSWATAGVVAALAYDSQVSA